MESNPRCRFPTCVLAIGAVSAGMALSLTAIIATEDEPGYLQQQLRYLALEPGDSTKDIREIGAWLAWRCRLRSERPQGYRSYVLNKRIHKLWQDYQVEESRARQTTLVSEQSEVTIRSLLSDPKVAVDLEPTDKVHSSNK